MLSPAGVLAPLLLAGVLLISAWAKWREPESTLGAIQLLRLPVALRRMGVARALPVGEALLALGMLAPWSGVARVASWVALALFITYAVLVARALTFDPRPTCGCFGRIGDQRIRPRTLVRNLIFVGAAVVLVAFTGAGLTVPVVLLGLSAGGWGWLLGALVFAAGVALVTGPPPPVIQEVAVAQAPAQVPQVSEDPEDYVRRPIPDALLLDPDGAPHTLRELAQERAQVLVFLTCFCGSTEAALETVQEWRPRLPLVDIRPVWSGVPPSDHPSAEGSFTDHGAVAWTQLALSGASPVAVLLGTDHLLAGGPVSGTDELQALLADIADALSGLPDSAQAPA